MHVAHDIHMPDPLPIGVGDFRSTVNRYARIRTEKIDLTEGVVGERHQPVHIVFMRDVGRNRQTACLGRDLPGSRRIDIRDDNAMRALQGKAPAQRAADPVAAARHYDDLAFDLHVSKAYSL